MNESSSQKVHFFLDMGHIYISIHGDTYLYREIYL